MFKIQYSILTHVNVNSPPAYNNFKWFLEQRFSLKNRGIVEASMDFEFYPIKESAIIA